jgi:hypothetical protein
MTNMINWKTFLGLTLLPLAGIMILEIKDFYPHEQMKYALQRFEVAFLLTIITAIVLLVQGIRNRRVR